MVRRYLFIALFLLGAVRAWAGASWLVSGPPQILGVSLSNSYFTGSPTAGTTIGALTVQTTGIPFAGTLTLGGPDAAKFAISGGNLNAAATLSTGIDYAITVTPSGGFPAGFHIYGGVTDSSRRLGTTPIPARRLARRG